MEYSEETKNAIRYANESIKETVTVPRVEWDELCNLIENMKSLMIEMAKEHGMSSEDLERILSR